DMTPDTLRDPVTTAQWEQRLEAITRGETSLEDFMREQYAALPLLLAPVLSTPAALQPGAFPCPKCGKALRRREGKNAGEFFWSCSDTDCRTFLPDGDGKPDQSKEKSPRVMTEFICPDCGKALLYRQGTSKAGKPYEVSSCSGYPNCKTSFWGKDGKPDFNRRPK
ncbi:topoisomerase DNA-binding C4 zinc finger domain-containing protein, partial [Bilophila wadsworthia]|uniref:topoisomerase DNA-binding C4 zinc finger domain-containing protein n=1 Tax=Bilophila wadsworthia TaxID=35833 RepID=UPI002431DEBA